MKTKTDRAALADSIGARRKACGYGVSQMTCASCRWCNHLNGWCDKNEFHINLDRGFCRDFDYILRTRHIPTYAPGHTRKTITRRTKA